MTIKSKLIILAGITFLLSLFVSCERNNEINGTYKITAAYAHVYHKRPHTRDDETYCNKKIKTKKQGEIITIKNNCATFGNETYNVTSGNGYTGEKSKGILEYGQFLVLFVGMNYDSFDENIIGADYSGTVKAMALENKTAKYNIFFADNKLILMIDANKHETEFEHLIVSQYNDHFFYIAEKILQ